MTVEQSPTVAEPIGAATEVTLWFRLGSGGYEFNHLEDGHSLEAKPTQKLPSQRSNWVNSTWVREHAWFDSGKSPKVLHDERAKVARVLATSK
jgi:hypothetical protein